MNCVCNVFQIEKPGVGGYSTVLEQMTASVSQLNVDNDVECRPCQTAGCEFFALQQHNWKCSRCYVNELTSSQSASTAAGHVQLTSYTTVQPTLEESLPRWNGKPFTALMFCSLYFVRSFVRCAVNVDCQLFTTTTPCLKKTVPTYFLLIVCQI